MFKVGDKIRFLNDVGEGKILSINQMTALVETEHGFEVEYDVKELVPAATNKDYNIDNLDKLIQQESRSVRAFERKKTAIKKAKGGEVMEVDLHIENLIDSHRGMANYQIVDLQMTNFRRSLNIALARRLKKVVFIHGIGEGVLRDEIREELKAYYPNFEFHDGAYHEYGQGATEVILRYN